MSTPADVPEVPEAPQKPQKQRKPPSPHIPRLFAAMAIITLLAVPVVVPVVIMKMTGKSGKKNTALSMDEVLEAPPYLSVVTAPEETTKEEIKESFLKLNNNKVCIAAAALSLSAPSCTVFSPIGNQRLRQSLLATLRTAPLSVG